MKAVLIGRFLDGSPAGVVMIEADFEGVRPDVIVAKTEWGERIFNYVDAGSVSEPHYVQSKILELTDPINCAKAFGEDPPNREGEPCKCCQRTDIHIPHTPDCDGIPS